MKSGKCPKCGSSTVYAKTNGVKYSIMQGTVIIHTTSMTIPSPVISYVCTTCGYFENYISDTNKLSEITQKWSKI